MLDGGGIKMGSIPFHFEIMCMKLEGFKEVLKGWCQGIDFIGSYSFVLAIKLKALKDILKV